MPGEAGAMSVATDSASPESAAPSVPSPRDETELMASSGPANGAEPAATAVPLDAAELMASSAPTKEADPTATASGSDDIEILPPAPKDAAAEAAEAAALARRSGLLRNAVLDKLEALSVRLGPRAETEQSVVSLLSAVLDGVKRESPGVVEKLCEKGDFAAPLSLSHPPSMVVKLVGEYGAAEGVGELRDRLLADFVPPEPTAYERRTKQEFRLEYPAPHFTKNLHDIGLQIVQERAYSDFVSLRNMPNEISDKCEQAKKVAEQVRPHLVKLRKETAHLQPKWLRCGRQCSFVADTKLGLHRHKQFLHELGGKNVCGLCGFSALLKEEVAKHYAEEHNCEMLYEPPLSKAPCPICAQDFDLKGSLILHLKDCKKANKYANHRQFQPKQQDKSAVNVWLWEKPKNVYLTGNVAGVSVHSGRHNVASTVQLVAQGAGHLRAPTAFPVARPQLQRYGTPQAAGFGHPMNFASGGRPTPRMRGGMRASSGPNYRPGTASFACEICDVRISDKSTLLYHFKSFHKKLLHKSVSELMGQAPLACSRCQERFWTYEGLERHLLMAHGLVTSDLLAKAQQKADQGRCCFCNKQYAFNILQHLVQDHKKKLCSAEIQYSCDVCAFTCTSYTALEGHLEAKHGSTTKRPLTEPSAPNPAKYPRLEQGPSKPAKLRYTCTPCALKFSQYAEVIEHWGQEHLKKIRVHACRIDTCEECKGGALAGLSIDWSPPEDLDTPEQGLYENASGRHVAAVLTGLNSSVKPLSTEPITLD